MGGMGWLNLIPQLPDFAGMGLNWAMQNKARDQYASQVRHLRRREYQDMVFSLKQAGLNPALAYGASPGHSGAYHAQVPTGSGSAGVGSAMAANRQAAVAEKKAPSEIELTGTHSQNLKLQRAGILQEFDKNKAWVDNMLQNTATAKALQSKYEQDAISGGASARKIEAEREALEKYGPPGASFEGMIREWLTDKDGPAAKAENIFESGAKKVEERMKENRSWGIHNYFNGRDYFGRDRE